MRVKLVYRNYKPLHKIYESLVENPPEGVVYIVPPVKGQFKKYYKYYKKFRYFDFFKPLIYLFEKAIFIDKSKDEDVDILHYINMIDENIPQIPYVVDIEHAASLVSFVPSGQRLKKAIRFLKNENCTSINCLSNAAMKSLEKLLGPEYSSIKNKVRITYPALELPDKNEFKADYSLIKRASHSINALFVGNQAYLKGLEELLSALAKQNKSNSQSQINLSVISDDAQEIVSKFSLKNVQIFAPKFSRTEMLEKFYIPSDFLIIPTKEDTFGMAFLDALSAGTAVVTTDQYAIPEIVSDGIDGVLVHLENAILDNSIVPPKEGMDAINRSNIDESLVNELKKTLNDIADGKIKLEKLGENGKKKFLKNGRFSVQARNKELLSIYMQCM